jgi:hypothetical protein
MWQLLKDRLDGTSSTKGRQLLQQKFLTTCPEVCKPIGDYIPKLENLCVQLTGTPQEIDDEPLRIKSIAIYPMDSKTSLKLLMIRKKLLTSVQVIKKIQHAEIAENNKNAMSANTSSVSGNLLPTYSAYRGRGRGTDHGRGHRRGNYRTIRILIFLLLENATIVVSKIIKPIRENKKI